MKKEAKKKLPKPLSGPAIAALLQKYAGAEAFWYLSTRSIIGAAVKDPLRAKLIVEQNGQRVGRWQVNTMTIGSVISRHLRSSQDLYAIPHLPGYVYDDYEQLTTLKKRAEELIGNLIGELNTLLRTSYELDDTPGLDLRQAERWWEGAAQVEAAIPLEKLWEVLPTMGQPHFKSHSHYLAKMLLPVEEGYAKLQVFNIEYPKPTTTSKGSERTNGKGQRFKKRHWYTRGEARRGMVVYSPECPYNEWERVVGEGGYLMRVKKPPRLGVAVYEEEVAGETELIIPQLSVRSQLLHIRKLVDDLLSQID